MTTPEDPSHQPNDRTVDIQATVVDLNDALTPTLTAAFVGVEEHGQAQRWAAGEQTPSSEHEAVLRFAHTVWRRVEGGMGRHAARAWMASANEILGEKTPITAIREGQRQAVLAAAEAAIRDDFAG